ncbi:MAG: 23S rRNA (guanosine(2251)-2'-O)-methyltransferase RlmB [bacterium]|nr:23S rRNA (guanosine(2251)-2'-O)-methyltransferase RlmB [bacterium]
MNFQKKIWGRHPVCEAVKSGKRPIEIIFLSKEAKGDIVEEIKKLAKEKNIDLVHKDKGFFYNFGQSHQGVAALLGDAERNTIIGVEDILEVSKKNGKPAFILLLDSITDPHNLGAILRTAESAGVDGVIIPKHRACGLTGTVAKTSAGAVEHVLIAEVTNLSQEIERLKRENIWVVGLDTGAEKSIYEMDLKMPLAIVIGSEGEGLHKLIKEKCDFLANLPMNGKINSLNASVAAGICLYEAVRQRKNS